MKRLEKKDTNIQRQLLLSSVLIGIAIFSVLFFAVPTSRGESSSPFDPPDVRGEVRYTDGTFVVGATVTLNNTRTGDEVPTKTIEDGTWCINMKTTIHARNNDTILITVSAPNSVEKTLSKTLIENTSELVQEVNFVFEKDAEEGPPGLPGDGDSASDEPSVGETKTNATATEEIISEDQPSPSPSPSPSQIGERENESVAGKSETPSPLKEEEEGKEGKRISGFQLVYSVSAGLIGIAVLFIIGKLRFTGKGGIKKG